MQTFGYALISAVVFSLMGVLTFGVSFWVVDRFTPYNLWKDIIEKGNVAVAILAGSMAISIGMIVSAAIHG